MARALEGGGGGGGGVDYAELRDALTSIEICVIEHADVIAMQNWTHVETTVSALNKMPEEQRDVDFSRVREYFLNGDGDVFRQNIILSATKDPQMVALFRRRCHNNAGKYIFEAKYPGLLSSGSGLKHVYKRLNVASIAEDSDVRFNHFKKEILPELKEEEEDEEEEEERGRGIVRAKKKKKKKGLLIFVPSYLDFVRLRNLLKAEGVSFASISEYSKPGDVTRSRSRFYHGDRRVLLYTERAHFYNRHRIRGIERLCFYGLPIYAHYYPELVSLVEKKRGKEEEERYGNATSSSTAVSVTYTKLDLSKLERVVGSARARHLVNLDKTTFVFV